MQTARLLRCKNCEEQPEYFTKVTISRTRVDARRLYVHPKSRHRKAVEKEVSFICSTCDDVVARVVPIRRGTE